MSKYQHKKCNGRVYLDLSDRLKMVSISVRILDGEKKIIPGSTDILHTGGENTSWVCGKCGEHFIEGGKNIANIECKCALCSSDFPVIGIRHTGLGDICNDCLNQFEEDDFDPESSLGLVVGLLTKKEINKSVPVSELMFYKLVTDSN